MFTASCVKTTEDITGDIRSSRLNRNRSNASAMHESLAVVIATRQPIRVGDIIEDRQSRAFLEAQLFIIRGNAVTQRLHDPALQQRHSRRQAIKTHLLQRHMSRTNQRHCIMAGTMLSVHVYDSLQYQTVQSLSYA